MNLIGSGIDARMQPRHIIPARPVDLKVQGIIDLILSDKGGRMTVDQVANLFRVGRSVVWNAIRSHARSKAPANHFPVEAV